MKFLHRLRRLSYALRRRPVIKSADCKIGRNVIFGKNVRIVAKYVRIGDGSVLGDNLRVSCEHFEIGDYATIYHDCFFPGGSIKIGHNFWLGVGSIVDGRAGTTIGNNVGVGAHSQLWTHMSFGGMLEGCRFHSQHPLTIGDDVWLVGHNLVSPVNIENRSMAMLGSLVIKDMHANRTYAGSPAVDITDKVGAQFQQIPVEEKRKIIEKYIADFATKNGLRDLAAKVKIFENASDVFDPSDFIQINVVNRTYKKTGSVLEYHLIRFFLPDVKLTPVN